jgi:phosphoribosylformylglycinamidine (FGAM) synthase-like amidotransferase family enzyme
MRMQSHKKCKDFVCMEYCNGCQVGHPSQRQHDCLVMNENERFTSDQTSEW